jgi:hypothetical protein
MKFLITQFCSSCYFLLFLSFLFCPLLPTHCRCRGHCCTSSHSMTQTHTLVRTPLDKWSVRRRYLYLTTHNTHKRQTSMPPAGFAPRNPSKQAAAEPRLKTRGHLDRLTSSHRYKYSQHVLNLNLCSSLRKRDQVPYPYNTAGESGRTRDRLKRTESSREEMNQISHRRPKNFG